MQREVSQRAISIMNKTSSYGLKLQQNIFRSDIRCRDRHRITKTDCRDMQENAGMLISFDLQLPIKYSDGGVIAE